MVRIQILHQHVPIVQERHQQEALRRHVRGVLHDVDQTLGVYFHHGHIGFAVLQFLAAGLLLKLQDVLVPIKDKLFRELRRVILVLQQVVPDFYYIVVVIYETVDDHKETATQPTDKFFVRRQIVVECVVLCVVRYLDYGDVVLLLGLILLQKQNAIVLLIEPVVDDYVYYLRLLVDRIDLECAKIDGDLQDLVNLEVHVF